MADIANLFGSLFGAGEIFRGAMLQRDAARQQASIIEVGGQLTYAGQQLTAAGLREQAKQASESLKFNQQIDNLNTQRQLKATSRAFQRTLGQQITTAATSGLDLTSKSFLQLRNEASDVFQQELQNIRIDAENRTRAQTFDTRIRQVNLENAARAAEHAASVGQTLTTLKANQARNAGELQIFSAAQEVGRGLPTLLSQVFDGGR